MGFGGIADLHPRPTLQKPHASRQPALVGCCHRWHLAPCKCHCMQVPRWASEAEPAPIAQLAPALPGPLIHRCPVLPHGPIPLCPPQLDTSVPGAAQIQCLGQAPSRSRQSCGKLQERHLWLLGTGNARPFGRQPIDPHRPATGRGAGDQDLEEEELVGTCATPAEIPQCPAGKGPLSNPPSPPHREWGTLHPPCLDPGDLSGALPHSPDLLQSAFIKPYFATARSPPSVKATDHPKGAAPLDTGTKPGPRGCGSRAPLSASHSHLSASLQAPAGTPKANPCD